MTLEVKTKLYIIYGFIEGLMEATSNQKMKDALELLMKKFEQLEKIIEDIEK